MQHSRPSTMASALQGVRLAARRSCKYRPAFQLHALSSHRHRFSTSAPLQKRLEDEYDLEDEDDDEPPESKTPLRNPWKELIDSLPSKDKLPQRVIDRLTATEVDDEDEDWDDGEDALEWGADDDDLITAADYADDARELAEENPDDEEPVKKKLKDTFMNMGEEEPWEEEGMLPDDDDDMTSLGHGELEKHREMRHYARLAAWEMPLLYKLAVPFKPPTAAQPLRFRYTTYMGEQHPGEKKVVVEFCPQDMPDLTEIQMLKLKKLVGPRYNPRNDTIKMSCDMFETQAQNKRYLGDTIGNLLEESRTGDMFEDVPLRAMRKNTAKPQFPHHWKMTERRRAQLEQHRKEVAARQETLQIEGKLVDGVQEIVDGLSAREPKIEQMEELVPVGKGKKGQRAAMRRH